MNKRIQDISTKLTNNESKSLDISCILHIYISIYFPTYMYFCNSSNLIVTNNLLIINQLLKPFVLLLGPDGGTGAPFGRELKNKLS